MEGSTSHGPQVPEKEGEDSVPLTDEGNQLVFISKRLMEIHALDKNFNEKSINDLLDLLRGAFPGGTPWPKSFEEVKKIAEEEEKKENQKPKEEEKHQKQKQEKASKKKKTGN